jgi:hypothetical protein
LDPGHPLLIGCRVLTRRNAARRRHFCEPHSG